MKYAVINNEIVENAIILLPEDAVVFAAQIAPKILAEIEEGVFCDIGYTATQEDGQWVFTAPAE